MVDAVALDRQLYRMQALLDLSLLRLPSNSAGWGKYGKY
jgi:hypothetical protein